ncbi:hypothetical protein CCACVL1_27620 [Corchorus capsularis]|uniref:Uncharacterized protein n=1 Tax=Corchorus capsularis TaxID=210143 RepID=A0A1R3G9I0_COCAP|nr:hypothetical protein CCACVL1_27620 [Corchorus capsularis]
MKSVPLLHAGDDVIEAVETLIILNKGTETRERVPDSGKHQKRVKAEKPPLPGDDEIEAAETLMMLKDVVPASFAKIRTSERVAESGKHQKRVKVEKPPLPVQQVLPLSEQAHQKKYQKRVKAEKPPLHVQQVLPLPDSSPEQAVLPLSCLTKINFLPHEPTGYDVIKAAETLMILNKDGTETRERVPESGKHQKKHQKGQSREASTACVASFAFA